MSVKITIELPDEVAQRAQALAAAGHRRLEDALVDWIGWAVAEPAVESLADDDLLRLCDSMLDARDQEELSVLLADSREGRIDMAGRARLDELMALYRHGVVLKVRAWREAVTRGLRTSPTESDAAMTPAGK